MTKRKNYNDDQIHPDRRTGRDVIPDTHDHAKDANHSRMPGCGETVYLPGDGFLVSHGGFSHRSKVAVYADKVREIRAAAGDKRTKFKLPQDGTYLTEEEILGYAAAIHAHRKMTGAKSRKEKLFDEARARQHPGTDAFDDAKDGLHRHSDEFDIDKSRSTIKIGLTQIGPPGMALNGSMIHHRNAVAIDLTTPDGRHLATAMCSPEQFAAALFSNSHTPCTLTRYWSVSDEDIMLTERVRPPQSIRKRMEARLKSRLQEQTDALREVAAEMKAQAETGKPARKTLLNDLADRIDRAISHSAANAAFTVDQAREEVTGIVESAALQFLGQQALDQHALWEVAGPALGMRGEPEIKNLPYKGEG